MKSDQSVPSSDLDFARRLSKRLRESGSSTQIDPRPRYVRFDARNFLPSGLELGAKSRGRTFGADTWNQLLDGCISAANADSAFLMEPQGLVVAARGALDAEVAEGIGARLMVALEQAAQMSPGRSHTICVEYEGRWLTGLRFSVGDAMLTMGIVAEGPLSRETRDVIEELLAATGAGGD